jgi:uncharacterized protein (TIGR02246 family)
MSTHPPLPPFTRETAIQKVRQAEDGWNSRDPEKVALAYTVDSVWGNRSEFPSGRKTIVEFLTPVCEGKQKSKNSTARKINLQSIPSHGPKNQPRRPL